MRRLLPCDGHLMAKLSGYIVMLCGEYSHLEFVFAVARERVKRTQSERLNTRAERRDDDALVRFWA